VLREPIDAWQFDAIRRDYETLRDRTADASARSILDGRLERLGRQEQVARAARRFGKLARQARDRDQELSDELATARETIADAPFDATGTLQVSSKEVGGQRVYALIGNDGLTSAYLLTPPAFPTRRYLTGQVGVRGKVQYDERLRARVIEITELESLAEAP
jgi:hypothetical protein